MSKFVEALESRELFSVTLHPKAAPTPTQVADLQAITDDIRAISQEIDLRTETLRGDLLQIPAIRREDLDAIRQDAAQIKVDHGNILAIRGDLAQLKTDRVKLASDIHAAVVQHISDVRSTALQLVTDRRTLAQARLQYLSDRIHHV
jgi:hypothetical protein